MRRARKKAGLLMFAVIAAAAIAPATCSAAAGIPPTAYTWTEQPTAVAPTGREGPAMEYDSSAGEVVLFGGGSEFETPDDTWTWGAGGWQERPSVPSPSARVTSAVDDPPNGGLLIFGGADNVGARLSDTWTWDQDGWVNQEVTGPSGRVSYAMAYDAATEEVVLFGGEASSFLGDTWVWNGERWEDAEPSGGPGPRRDPSMAYDAATEEVVLFGGTSPGFAELNDTWTWDGTHWTQQSPAHSPPTRSAAVMFYDAAIEEVVLFGGYVIGREMRGDTWTWNGQDWTRRDPTTSPPGRRAAGAAYDPRTEEGVIFSGETEAENAPDETWTYHAIPAPTATIGVPADGASYALGSVVSTSFSCVDADEGPGIESCLDANGKAVSQPLDTSTLGPHTVTVIATSKDGRSASVTSHYTVVAVPSADSTPKGVAPPTTAIPSSLKITHRPQRGNEGRGHGRPRYSFRFADPAPGAKFLCSLDGAAFHACRPPQIYRHLKPGPHTFRVYSVGPGGAASAVRRIRFVAAAGRRSR
jgi:hypothetical protein